MTREKQMILLFPKLVGKKIKIFTKIPNSHWAIADVVKYSGGSIILKNVEIYNGLKQTKRIISGKNISKIELIN